jgi:hypothetical protein
MRLNVIVLLLAVGFEPLQEAGGFVADSIANAEPWSARTFSVSETKI